MTDFVAYQDVECVFPMSGQYGRAPRFLYYGLLLFVVLLQKQDWLTAGAAAACLTYGGCAAIHALILASTLSLGHTNVPDESVLLANGTVVYVRALATDLDSDATFALVGAGFLVIVPMALWSVRFKLSSAVPILVLWTFLMSIGMVASMTNFFYTMYGLSPRPLAQFRFCTLGYNDSFPISSNAINAINNSWNETIWTYFNSSENSFEGCYYPCLSASSQLHQSGDAKVVAFDTKDYSGSMHVHRLLVISFAFFYMFVSLYSCCMLLSFRLNYILFENWHFGNQAMILRLRGLRFLDFDVEFRELIVRLRRGERPANMQLEFGLIVDRLRGDLDTNTTSGAITFCILCAHRLLAFSNWINILYSKIVMWIVFPVFLILIEVLVISYDLHSESMGMVGQWAPLVGAGLTFVAAIVEKYWEPTKWYWLSYWRRRGVVKACSITESVWGSISSVQNYDTATAWNKIGSANFRLED